MPNLSIEIVDGTRLLVPANLSTMTTYILLEQEDWFEREMPFVRRFLRPGMTALDIGANVGIYSLVMGRLVGPTGAVHAFEPASSPRSLLLEARAANGLRNLVVHPVALSDAAGRGQLSQTGASEIASLQGDRTAGGEKPSISRRSTIWTVPPAGRHRISSRSMPRAKKRASSGAAAISSGATAR